jgi:hypothetical protein
VPWFGQIASSMRIIENPSVRAYARVKTLSRS